MAIQTPRRYYLLKRRAALAAGEPHLAGFWRAKQEALYWPALPSDFPARAALVAAGYTTVRDLDGADTTELRNLGLTRDQADAVVAAMESWTMIAATLNNYQRQDGRFAKTYAAPLLASASRSASGVSDTYEMGDMSCLRLKLDVTVITGTLDCVVETSPDGVNEWQPLLTFAQKSAVSSERNAVGGADRFVRVTYTIVTGPATFSLTGEAC